MKKLLLSAVVLSVLGGAATKGAVPAEGEMTP